ncbi:MAG: GDP-mannose 4,6-dehydratase, partial [Defluviitaleaceae bacterium]|nr:GDP-mannose 4,6-dehydratase [Defluviitaleaceae bacterium]
LIPNILKTALKINAVFELMGNDYDTKDGTCVRDYIHVDDLADAHILSLEKLMRGENSAVYNLGSGTGFSNKEILDAAVRITGIDIPVKISPRRPGDPPVLIASSEKIKSELLWNPSRTNLESLIGTAWEWHRANPGGYGS